MSAQTAQVTNIHGASQAVAMPPDVIRAFKQTGLDLILDRKHHARVMLANLVTAWKLNPSGQSTKSIANSLEYTSGRD
jgi:hypothetical protein